MVKKTIAVIVLVVLFFGGIIAYLLYDYSKQNGYDVDSIGAGVEHTEYKNVEKDGVSYTFNPRIDTILYIGVDQTDGLDGDSLAGRADVVILFVLNKDTGKITSINFSRDTMTAIRTYTADGQALGTTKQHLAYAFQFAGGGKAGCQNVAWSVSNLLGGIPIEEYVATDIKTIVAINDLVGGVTVTVPNDDLGSLYPEFAEGATVKLNASNVETFVRYRDTEVDFSNNTRRERQKAFLNAFFPQLSELISKDMNSVWEKYLTLEKDTISSITRNEYIDIANNFLKMDYGNVEFYTPEGEDKNGELHDEFYIDEEALQKKILEIFYISD
ncbi:MAG: LCP family protein [Lachnospiraceae bacterium]|nr:LCP family protein [Lachnospiraceae bacterium]